MGRIVFIAALTFLLIFVSSRVSVQHIQETGANPSWGWVPGVVPSEPSKDKPILIIESPNNYSICDEGKVTLKFTVIKPISWNHTVVPFGDCANGHIKSVNVSLNGAEVFQDYLNADNLNGGSYWNKSYSLRIDGVHLGTNSLSVTVFANSFYIDNNNTNKTVSICPMNVTEIVYLISGFSPTAAPTPSVPEFTLRFVENPYDVPPTIKTDPYTGKNVTTQGGYHVESKSIEVVMQNNMGASFYNFRYKGHYEDNWSYEPFNPNSSIPYFLSDSFSVPFNVTNVSSSIVVFKLHFLPPALIAGSQIDVQAQALFGNFDASPYGHVIDVGGPTYDFTFKGTTSYWSGTQTITVPETPSASPSPSLSISPSPSPTHSLIPLESPTQTPTLGQSNPPNPPPWFDYVPYSLLYQLIVIAIAVITIAVCVIFYFKKKIKKRK